MADFIRSTTLLLLLLNPFLLIIYMLDIVNKVEGRQFRQIMLRASLIALAVFCSFAIFGDLLFENILQAQFASFQIFGGLLFLLIGLQFFFRGPGGLTLLQGESEHLAGAIAMPVLIGPGTLSASIVIGKRHDALTACLAVGTALLLSMIVILLLKKLHDYMQPRNDRLIRRYIETAGRITALYIGTIAIEMIMQGLRSWLDKF